MFGTNLHKQCFILIQNPDVFIDRNDLNNAGKICKIKLSDKGTSSSGERAMFGDSLPSQMLLANNGNFFVWG